MSITLQINPELLPPPQIPRGLAATFGGALDELSINLDDFNRNRFCKVTIAGLEFEPSPISSGSLADEYFVGVVVTRKGADMAKDLQNVLLKSLFKQVPHSGRDQHSMNRVCKLNNSLEDGPLVLLGQGIKKPSIIQKGIFGDEAKGNVYDPGLLNSVRRFSLRNSYGMGE